MKIQRQSSIGLYFTGKSNILGTSAKKMELAAKRLLEQNNFYPGQMISIDAEAYSLPFMNTLTAEAYKAGAKHVDFVVREPEIEILKQRFNITETFDYIKDKMQYLNDMKALMFKFDSKNNPFHLANLNPTEINAELKRIAVQIPKHIQDIFKINPEEIFKTALTLHEGQPVYIKAEREHLPYITKLMEYLYSKNKTKLVDIDIQYDNAKNLYRHAWDEFLDYIPPSRLARQKETFEKDIAYLKLEGQDPNRFAGIDSNRINRNNRALLAEIGEYHSLTTSNVPWLVYYAPTTKSALAAYPEYGKNGFKALEHALKDAVKINRMGSLPQHVDNLDYRAIKMNELLAEGYSTLHYVSVDPITKLPNNKTDFKVTMSPESMFISGRMDMPKYEHKPIVNIPTEEVFSSPKADTAEGVISSTMPLSLNGKIVEGIQFKFEKGKIVNVKATKNEELLKSHIASYENADRLGEVAIVADSPIRKLNRLFKSTLLDENASPHLAIGNAYPDTIRGATEIEDFAALKKYLKDLNINTSQTHNDFMVGDENVIITAINPQTGKSKLVVKDDKFML